MNACVCVQLICRSSPRDNRTETVIAVLRRVSRFTHIALCQVVNHTHYYTTTESNSMVTLLPPKVTMSNNSIGLVG